MSGYNGWKNWETWNVSLWVDNEEMIYRAKCSHFRNRTPTESNVETFVKEWFPDGTPDFVRMGKGARDFDLVDWEEIASNWETEFA